MADRVNKEVARERLRRACKAGTIVSAIVLVLGLCYAGVAVLIGMGVNLPFQFMRSVLFLMVPTMDDVVLGTTEAATKALLLVLMGLFGILASRKIAKGSEPFRLGQLRQFKFVALLALLLGFLPTLLADLVKIGTSLQAGQPALAVLSFSVEPLCVLVGIMCFAAARILVAGGVFEQAEEMGVPYDAAGQTMADAPDLSSRIPNIGNTYAAPAEELTTALPAEEPTTQVGFAPATMATEIPPEQAVDATMPQPSQEQEHIATEA